MCDDYNENVGYCDECYVEAPEEEIKFVNGDNLCITCRNAIDD